MDGNSSFGSVGRARYTNNIQYETGEEYAGFIIMTSTPPNNVKLEAADYNTFIAVVRTIVF